MDTKPWLLYSLLIFLFLWCFASIAGAAETIVYSEGFEANNGGYTVITSGSSAGWQWGTPAASPGPGSAHAGLKCWGTNFGNIMPRPADESIVSPPIKLPQASANQVIRVRFWAFVSLDGMYDRGQFFVSRDNVNWDSLAQFYNNMETNCGIAPTWHKYEFTIDNSYAADPNPDNNIIYLRMRAAVQNSTPNFFCPPYTADDLSGVYFDDLAITYYDIPITNNVFSLAAWEDPSAWASCPWVAPWNGSRFQVDNDIYSVARMSENEYRDTYRLSVPLLARNGVYPVEIQERESEDSYTDYVALLELDHPLGVAIAPDEKGGLHAYKPSALLPPVSAITNGTNVTSLLTTADGKGVAGYNGTMVLLDFGKAAITNGATLVLKVKGFVIGTGIPQAYSGTPAVIVETMDTSGTWRERGRLLPRFESSTQAFDLKPFITNGQSITVRLRSISHDVKYHLIDYAALYSGAPPGFTVRQVAPSRATFGSQNVLGTLLTADGNYVKLSPGEKISLEFPAAAVAAGTEREFIFASKGYYVPKSGSYLISTWDGATWVQRDGHSYTGSVTSRDYHALSLPDPEGRYRVRIWQDYQYEGAGIDFVQLTIGGVVASLLKAFDNRTGSDVTAELATLDNTTVAWSYCPRDRVVDVEFTPPGPINIPPTTNPVVVTNLGSATPTISWNYTDPDGDPQALSQLQVWTGPGATGVILWNPPVFSGTGTSKIYGGIPLLSGVTYYARLQANDGQAWGPWSEASFIISLLKCDIDGDGDVDTIDLSLISKARGQRAIVPNDPRDSDGDGWITPNDVIICIKKCTRANCK
jgi:hypothetical protein